MKLYRKAGIGDVEFKNNVTYPSGSVTPAPCRKMELKADVIAKSDFMCKSEYDSSTANILPFSFKKAGCESTGGKASGREMYAIQAAMTVGFIQFDPVPP